MQKHRKKGMMSLKIMCTSVLLLCGTCGSNRWESGKAWRGTNFTGHFCQQNIPDIVLWIPRRQKSTDSDVIIHAFVCVDVLKGSLGRAVRVVILDAMRVLRNRYWEGTLPQINQSTRQFYYQYGRGYKTWSNAL